MVWNAGFINCDDNIVRFGIHLELEKERQIYSVCTVLFDWWIFVFDYNSIFVIINEQERMKKGFLKSLLLAVMGGFYALSATAASSLFSDYGQIQNVQNYSTNPFWTPSSPYNQRLPQPVYVQGADLNDEDCFKVVQSLVSVQCMARDNCKNTTLAEIRPTVMVQLSNLPGNNYVSACAGYIDYVFEQYVAQYGNSLPNRAVTFPTGTTANPNLNNNNNSIEIKNPYKKVTPKWQQDIKERSDELQSLQRQNGAGSEHLSANAFPTTFEDLSFSERIAVKTEGYEPYKDATAYVVPDFKRASEWCADGDHASSPECVAYNDCTKTLKGKVDHLVRAKYNADHSVCQVNQCDAGWVPNSKANACILNEGTPCTLAGVEHVVSASIDSEGNCKIKKCENGWKPSTDGTECEVEVGYECNAAAKQMDPHATTGEFDANGECTITGCEKDWFVSDDKKSCKEISFHMELSYDDSIDGWWDWYKQNVAILAPKFEQGYCFIRCNDTIKSDGLNEALHLTGVLPKNKKVCAHEGKAPIYIYYFDNPIEKVSLPMSQSGTVSAALNIISQDFWQGCDLGIFNIFVVKRKLKIKLCYDHNQECFFETYLIK